MTTTLSLNESLKKSIQVAQAFAKEYKNERFSSAHLLRGLLHEEVGLTHFLKSIDKDVSYIIDWAEVRIDDYPKSAKPVEAPAGDDKASVILEEADTIRVKLGLDEISPICVLTAISKPNIAFTGEQLKSFPIKEREILDIYLRENALETPTGKDAANSLKGPATGAALYKYCTDKTSLAKEGRIDPIIARDKETRMMIEILGRRTKPNVIVIGEPGVGKTALAEGLALQIVQGHVPDNLRSSLLFQLDLGMLAAGASYKGEMEERLKNIIKEIKQLDKAILFIDEIHTLLDPKGISGNGIANLLKPELANGKITVIGTSTNDEYRKIIEPDQAFNRRFEVLRVEEPDTTSSVKMVSTLVSIYETHHKIKVAPDAIPECVRLAKRYIKDRRLPDSAIDLLDRTMAAIKMMDETSAKELEQLKKELEQLKNNSTWNEAALLQELKWFHSLLRNKLSPVLLGKLDSSTDAEEMESAAALSEYLDQMLDQLLEITKDKKNEVSRQDIAAVMSYKTGIPLGKIQAQEKEKLLHMETYLKHRVVGQDHALKSLTAAVLESRSGLNKPGQPIGSFFFLGPTGTGKTELTKTIAEFLFNDEKSMIRFDMSEFKEEHSAALLYGAPPGYVGYEEGGMLVNKIRQQPYSVVLFDEIEKAHPSVFDIFLQILDEGKMHDRLGKEGDFSNSIIIFTSNIGSEWIVEQFNKNEIPKSNQLMEIMARHFRPEFLARLTEIIPFAPISEQHVVKILEYQMRTLMDTLNKQGIRLEIAEEAKKTLAMTGFTPKYGARQLAGVVRNHLRRPLSRMIISGEVKKGSNVQVNLNPQGEIEWKTFTEN